MVSDHRVQNGPQATSTFLSARFLSIRAVIIEECLVLNFLIFLEEGWLKHSNTIITFLMWTPCPRNQHAYSCCRSRNPSYLPDLASGNHARGSRDIVVSKIRHGAFSTFCRRILRGGYTAWRILRSGTKEGPAGWSFNPSAEGAMATARPPLPLLICPSLSFCHLTAVALRVVTYSSRRSLIVRTLCQRREEWDYDPPAVLTGNFY